MSAHTHTAYVEGCFRCDLSRDEVAADPRTPSFTAWCVDLAAERALADQLAEALRAEASFVFANFPSEQSEESEAALAAYDRARTPATHLTPCPSCGGEK